MDELSSKAFKRANNSIHGKLKNYFLTHYSHCMVPGLNLSKSPSVDCWNVDNAMGMYQEFPYNCDLPKPLLPPVKMLKNVLNEGDPALQLISTKAQIDDDIKRILDHYQKHKTAYAKIPQKKDVKWKENNTAIQVTLPRYIADLADMIEMDPDPHFSGKYNWYHTGGSLSTVSLSGEKLLLFPYMNELVASPINSRKNSLWKPNLRKAASCDMKEGIYELRRDVQNNSCRILGRSKHCCVFFSLGEQCEKLCMIQVHKDQSKLPLVSADLDPSNYNKYCTANVERTVTLWDMVSCKTVISNAIQVSKVLENKWASVRFSKWDPNTVVFADRCCVHYLDTRDSFERPVLSLCPTARLESCEGLCLELPSSNENYNYVGTYHSLLMCDWRSPRECVQQKWTHQFKSAPLLAAVHARDEKEVVVLSSQSTGETAIILNTWISRDNPHSYNLPYTPPSVLETLKESQLRGKCLDPLLRKRLELCNAGSSLVADDNGDLFFFLQNSIGDVFYQRINYEEILDKFSVANSQSCDAMEAWEKRILTQERLLTPLVITDRTNMHHVFSSFTNKNLSVEHEDKNSLFLIEPKWKQSLQKLNMYVDILAPELLAVWEISEENVPVPQTTVPHQKVLNWLEVANDKSVEGSQELIGLPVTPVNTQELYSVSQQPEFIDVTQDIPEKSYYPPVKVKTGRKLPTKKRTYVAGF